MKTFQEWLNEAINRNAYDTKVARIVQQQSQRNMAPGVTPKDGLDAREMIQKAAVKAITPDTVKPALDSTTIQKKKPNANVS